jgi:hypothetical protein
MLVIVSISGHISGRSINHFARGKLCYSDITLSVDLKQYFAPRDQISFDFIEWSNVHFEKADLIRRLYCFAGTESPPAASYPKLQSLDSF